MHTQRVAGARGCRLGHAPATPPGARWLWAHPPAPVLLHHAPVQQPSRAGASTSTPRVSCIAPHRCEGLGSGSSSSTSGRGSEAQQGLRQQAHGGQAQHDAAAHDLVAASTSGRPLYAGLTTMDSWDFSEDEVPPSPSNLPTGAGSSGSSSGSGDAGETLYAPRRDLWMLTDQPGIDLLLAGPAALEHLQVYVILFGVGERDTEGIYSLRAFGDDGLPQETIIVFETEEDAQRYAGLLEATMDHTPVVCSIPPRELLDFCVDQGYNCRLEPCGSLLIPPDFNVGVTDWERSMRLRDGRWAVLDAEPERAPPPAPEPGAPAEPVAPPATPAHAHLPPVANASSLARYHPSFSKGQLQQIRDKLEGLLPQGGKDK